MLWRLEKERQEEKYLSRHAALSSQSKGRKVEEEHCQIRTDFQRDRDRIIHSKAFRRLKFKTQVFLAPEGDHFRTRLTHTLEVAQIARTIAISLGLNEDLTEAIALGHDLGHTPFGHAGEEVLHQVYREGFRHNEQSLRVVDILENDGQGLNLTAEVRDGILNHTGKTLPVTLEGQIVKISDRLAYINHDIDDALRAGIIYINDLPRNCLELLGFKHRDRINTMVTDIIKVSWDKQVIQQGPQIAQATKNLRDFLFHNVYYDSPAKAQEGKAKQVIRDLFSFLIANPHNLPEGWRETAEKIGLERLVCDYIAGMTDRYAVNQFIKHFVPSGYKTP